MSYFNDEEGLGQEQGELPSHPSGVTLVNVCPRCSHPVESCVCQDWKKDFYSDIGSNWDGEER